MNTYKIAASAVSVSTTPATLLKLAFGEPAQNDAIVRDAVSGLEEAKLEGGELVLLNGPASLPAACAIAHGVGHLFGAVAVFDPKMAGYVVSICHGEKYSLGQIIPAAEVLEA